MQKTLLFVLFLSGNTVFADDVKDLITNPAISKRCRQLITERDQKVESIQHLSSLLRRTNELIGKARNREVKIKKNLKYTHTKIKNNLIRSKLRLQVMEENIVRKGCPGVIL